MALTRPELEQFAKKERGNFERLLKEFVEIPSVSADPDAQGGPRALRRARARDRPGHSAAGPRSTASPTGRPSCWARSDAAKGRPTVTIYNHLDVLPASNETEPWRDGALHVHPARATATSAAAPPTTRARRWRRSSGRARRIEAGVPVNIQLLWELEEEIGSPHFEPHARARSAALRRPTRWWCRTPSGCRARRPACPAGLRGLQRHDASRLETGADRPALRADGRRGAQPVGRARAARLPRSTTPVPAA